MLLKDAEFGLLVYCASSRGRASGHNLRREPATIASSTYSIAQHLRFNNRHDSSLLTDGRVAREHIRVLGERNVRRRVRADVEDAAPFGEIAAAFFELLAALGEAVEALRCTFAACACKQKTLN